MLEYDKFDISDGIDVNKTSTSKRMWYLSIQILVLSRNHIFVMAVTI